MEEQGLMRKPRNENDLRLMVHRASNKAFSLAQQFAAGAADLSRIQAKARELNRQLDELWPLIQQSTANEQVDLSQAWSDARLDLGYILSGGQLSTSTRLYYYLQGLKQK